MSEIWSKMYIGLHVKYALFFSDFNETWIFSNDFLKIVQHKVLRKFVQWKQRLFHEDRRTVKRKITRSWFCNFSNAPEKKRKLLHIDLQFHSLTEEYEGSFIDDSRTVKAVSLWNVRGFLTNEKRRTKKSFNQCTEWGKIL
jgi:hypothetical protein